MFLYASIDIILFICLGFWYFQHHYLRGGSLPAPLGVLQHSHRAPIAAQQQSSPQKRIAREADHAVGRPVHTEVVIFDLLVEGAPDNHE